MDIILPALTNTDFRTIAHLAEVIWTEHYTPIIGTEQVIYMLEKFQSTSVIEDQVKNGYFYFLIQDQNTPVGYFSFMEKEDHIFLSKLYVLHSSRGQGLGKAALHFLDSQTRARGFARIQLTVNKFNSNSIKAYEKMGFRNIRALVQAIGNGYVMDDFVLEKRLKGLGV